MSYPAPPGTKGLPFWDPQRIERFGPPCAVPLQRFQDHTRCQSGVGGSWVWYGTPTGRGPLQQS